MAALPSMLALSVAFSPWAVHLALSRALMKVVRNGVSAAASVGLTILYGLGGHPQLEGALIFGTMSGLSAGFILWGKKLLPQGPFVEEREPMTPTAEMTRSTAISSVLPPCS